LIIYRRKILLALLQALGGKVPRRDFQKYLFLLSRFQKKPAYDFVPYKYGSFSFQSYADRRSLESVGILSSDDEWFLKSEDDYLSDLTPDDRAAIARIVDEFSSYKGDRLVRYVYREYPYFAIRSEIADRLLEPDELAEVKKLQPNSSKTGFFSIGYEGKSIDSYLDMLIQSNIKAVCDVRKNALSRKYGFSRRQLESCLNNVGISYHSFSDLGIESKDRCDLESYEDYQRLFDRYESQTLAKQTDALQQMISVLGGYKRVAFTCFEANHTWCHRSRVAKALEKHPDYCRPVVHL
jgi:uncharacterized protein (DUF488 family)